ncbi:hypothetical protein OE88DRAFT_1676793 [Heliocybe sulcata]|uniref:Zn(2)-C6 fungal-type domain-containing protein n=1 Tax=Heliocybe sulcata TaxID=5364 RepID=A0A5C3N8L0_9AGAM|nr:hypothetical protein OE88DRAFT_1676793 [Heliocybe sulcata]
MAPRAAEYDSDGEPDERNSKKRKTKPGVRACDVCRRKKIRCDGPQGPDNKCLNCISFKTECTYGEVVKKRGPPKGYTHTLETRVSKLEDLLRKHCPDLDLDKEVGPPLNKHSYRREQANLPLINADAISTKPKPSEVAETSRQGSGSPVAQTDVETSEDEYLQNSLAEDAQRLSIKPSHHRYLGKASGISLIEAVIQLKVQSSGTDAATLTSDWGKHRRLVTHYMQWEVPMYQDEHPDFVFPEPDLMNDVVDLYFTKLNSLSPLLHRPTFQANIDDNLHLRDHKFAAVLLAVCAIGSRFSDDPRVYSEPDTPQSAGWQYYNQVHKIRRSLVAPPCLYDIQVWPLLTFFLLGSSSPHAVWGIIGIGLRIAQDVGANRRRFYGDQMTVETEMWKRAFWVLVTAERGISAALGRPTTIQDEDIDVDWPAECDDEYWTNEDPAKAFKQPPGKPSSMCFYIYGLRLANIQGSALRTIYSTGRRRAFFGQIGQDWEERTVAEMDSTLNKWFDDMPDHLRWIPTSDNLIFFRQSAQMHVAYNYNQILVHRPFIASSRKATQLTVSCMAICTNAARSIVNVADVTSKRGESIPGIIVAVFTSAVILMMHALGGKRAGLSSDPAKGINDVLKAMDALRFYEERWHLAGAYWDILWSLGKVADLLVPPPRLPDSLKRSRDSGLLVSDYGSDSIPGHQFHPVFNPLMARNFRSDFANMGDDLSSRLVGSTAQQSQTPPGVQLTAPYAASVTRTAALPSEPSADHSGALPAGVPTSVMSPGRLARRHTRITQEPSASEPLFLPGQGPPAPPPPPLSHSSTSDGLDAQYPASELDDMAAFFHAFQSMSQHTADSEMTEQQRSYQTAPQTWSFDANTNEPLTQQQQQALDNEILAAWSNVPTALMPGEWDAYFSGLGDLTHSQDNTTHSTSTGNQQF